MGNQVLTAKITTLLVLAIMSLSMIIGLDTFASFLVVLAIIALTVLIAILLWKALRIRECTCDRIPPKYWRRPDPYIYSQKYLSSLGMEVTWDNPDIWLEAGGVPLSDNPTSNTDYEIVIAIHNNSVETKAIDTLVEIYTSNYGAGEPPVLLGIVMVPETLTLGNPPTIARIAWKTPSTTGHHCITVRLKPVDDTNTLNNEGGKNIRLVKLGSNTTQLSLPIYNPHAVPIHLKIEVTSHIMSSKIFHPSFMTSSPVSKSLHSAKLSAWNDSTMRNKLVERQKQLTELYKRGKYLLPEAWLTDQSTHHITVNPHQRVIHSIAIQVPDGVNPGTYAITLNAYRSEDNTLYGGVTELVRMLNGPTHIMAATTQPEGKAVSSPGITGSSWLPDPKAIRRTKCIEPKDRDKFGPGQRAAIFHALIYIAAGLGAQLGLGVAGTALDILLLLAGINSYVDWWLNRRLLCLEPSVCAIGIIWNLEPPQGKEGLEKLDNDYSVNLLLSPAAPGDDPIKYSQQAHLVKPHPKILAEGLPTFGADHIATIANVSPQFVTRVVSDDPDEELKNLQNQGLTDWTQFGAGLKQPKDSTIWDAGETGDSRPSESLIALPHTQLLHCEFEGTAISNIHTIVLLGGAAAGLIIAGLGDGIAAGGVAAAAAVAAGFLAFLIILAILAWLASHSGDPENAGVPDVQIAPIANREGAVLNATWDSQYTLVAIRGRWVYDYGHSRGWNEIHPVTDIIKITDDKIDADLVARGLPPIRPRNDAELKLLIDKWCH